MEAPRRVSYARRGTMLVRRDFTRGRGDNQRGFLNVPALRALFAEDARKEDNSGIAPGVAAMNEDRFLLSLISIAARRGTRFVLRTEEATETCDKWLCLMAGVTPQQLRNGILTESEVRKLRMAAKMLDDTPVYVADGSGETPRRWD